MSKLRDDRYQIIRELGSGGMGKVWLAEDTVRQQQVALKSIEIQDAETLRLFKQEFRIMEQLRHPNLVRFYELDKDEDGPYFTMEALEGWTLEEFFDARNEEETQIILSFETSGFYTPIDMPAINSIVSSSQNELPTLIDVRGETLSILTHTGKNPFAPKNRKKISPTNPLAPPLLEESEKAFPPLPKGEKLRRLRLVLPQLLQALGFLHKQGFVHRDLKPENVVITTTGQVKLLDFGILAELTASSQIKTARKRGGTPGYMAPEQMEGKDPTPASDLYSLGAILFYLTSGTPVFPIHDLITLIHLHITEEAPLLSERDPDALPILVEVCQSLLDKQPENRMTLHDINQRVLLELGCAPVDLGKPDQPEVVHILDRKLLQETLYSYVEALQRGHSLFATLEGSTGVGKSALGIWTCRLCESQDVLVLRGQGRRHDKLPFNVIDGAIDQLSVFLKSEKEKGNISSSMLSRMKVAASVFPVLSPTSSNRISYHPEHTRLAAFESIIALLSHLAKKKKGLLFFLDDFHWADADSLAFLQFLVDVAPICVGVIATYRDDVGKTLATDWLEKNSEIHRLEVKPISANAISKIIQRIAWGTGNAISSDQIESVVQACAGNPFLAELSGRMYSTLKLQPYHQDEDDSVLYLYALQALEKSKALLTTILITDGWIEVQTLTNYLGMPYGKLEDILGELEQDGVIRRSAIAGGEDKIDLYHDALRGELYQLLSKDELQEAHFNFANWLKDQPKVAPERLVYHYLESNHIEYAIYWAWVAARRAEHQSAYGLAAEMYEVALMMVDSQKDRVRILSRYAQSLEKLGDYAKAIDCWQEVKTNAEGEEQINAALSESFALMAANRFEEGHRNMQIALQERKRSPWIRKLSKLWTLIRFLVGPSTFLSRRFRKKNPTPNLEKLPRLQRDIWLATILSYYENLSGLDLFLQGRKRFAQAGCVEQVAWCDYMCAYLSHALSRRPKTPRMTSRFVKSAEILLEGMKTKEAVLHALPILIKSMSSFRAGRTQEGLQYLGEGIQTFENSGCTGSFEHTYTLGYYTWWYTTKQDLEGSENIQEKISSLPSGQDFACSTFSNNAATVSATYRGDFSKAYELLKRTSKNMYRSKRFAHLYIHPFIAAIPALYDPRVTDYSHCSRDLKKAWQEGKPSRIHDSILTGFLASIAAMVEVRLLRSEHPKASLSWFNKMIKIAETSVPFLPAWSWRAKAYAANALGKPKEAIRYLERAISIAIENKQPIDEAIASYQLGLRLGGAASHQLRQDAQKLLEQIGAHPILLQEDRGSGQ